MRDFQFSNSQNSKEKAARGSDNISYRGYSKQRLEDRLTEKHLIEGCFYHLETQMIFNIISNSPVKLSQ